MPVVAVTNKQRFRRQGRRLADEIAAQAATTPGGLNPELADDRQVIIDLLQSAPRGGPTFEETLISATTPLHTTAGADEESTMPIGSINDLSPDGLTRAPMGRDRYVEYIIEQSPTDANIHPALTQLFEEWRTLNQDGSRDGSQENEYRRLSYVVDSYVLIYQANAYQLLEEETRDGRSPMDVRVEDENSLPMVVSSDEIVEAERVGQFERQRALAAGQETNATRKGNAAINYLLSKEQCVLSYLTKQILESKLDFSKTNQENIIQIFDEDINLLVNLLNGKAKLKDFFNLETPNLSLMVPKIRLYKQLFEFGDTVDLREAGTIEFKFDSFTRNSAISEITNSGFGRGNGVGIKKADWSYEGTNPEEVTTFINFDLTLFFQNIKDLLPNDATELPGAEGSDAASRAVFYDRNNANLIQLIAAGSGGRNRSTANDVNQPLYFTIKAELGWELDPSVNHSLTSQQISDLKDIIDSTVTHLELSLIEHSLNFNNDGTLNLDLKYAAGIDQQLSDNNLNVLRVGTAGERNLAVESIVDAADIDSAQSEVEINENDDTPVTTSGQRCGPSALNTATIRDSSTGEGEQITLTERDRSIIRAARATSENQNIFNNYDAFFRRLLSSGKVYEIELDRAVLAEITNDPNLNASTRNDAERNEAQNQRRIDSFELLAEFLTIQKLQNIEIKNFRVISTGEIESIEVLDEATADIVREAVGSAEDESESREAVGSLDYTDSINLGILQELSDSEDGTYKIKFFRLGDILDQIISGLKELPNNALSERPDSAFTFISGLYTFLDVEGRRHGMNFCDILISINKFREFFVEEVVKPLKTVYNLKNFIIDMISSFSYVASTTSCTQNTFVRSESRPTFSVFQSAYTNFAGTAQQASVGSQVKGALPGFVGDAVGDLGNNIVYDMSFLRTNLIEGRDSTINAYIGPDRLSNFFVIQGSNFILAPAEGSSLAQRENHDAGRGVYHIRLGSNRGLLKDISFKKDEIAGRREGRIVSEGGFNLSVLREKYNADLTLVGCSFIYPGMYIYIDPSMVGMGFSEQSNSAAQLLGLGGYYFVNKVTNSITEGGTYTTNLETIWNTFGDSPPCPLTIVMPGRSPDLAGAAATNTPAAAPPPPGPGRDASQQQSIR